jgi:hypothetical protein
VNSKCIQKDEVLIVGNWIMVDGRAMSDDNELRIKELIEEDLRYLATSSDGWERLYTDPADGRLWEQTCLHGEMQGGGPQTLRCIGNVIAREKYNYHP